MTAKHFGWRKDYILWDISYVNLVMLLRAAPSHKLDTDEKGKTEEAGGLDDFGSFFNQ